MQLNQSQRNIRLWIDGNLAQGNNFELSSVQAHYLNNVMRCVKNDTIKCFNADDGEFWCQLIEITRNKAVAKPVKKLRNPETESDIWLLFAPLKKDKTDFVIEKAVELGVSCIVPVITERTNVKQVKTERYIAQAIEAAEQCERLSIPVINNPLSLREILDRWDKKRILYFADERRTGKSAIETIQKEKNRPCAVLIGPEGGFSDDEANFINSHEFVKNINLGKRILRAETAACATLAIWQATAGDWQ